MGDDIAIKIDHVSKTFKLPHEKNSSLKGALINFHKRGYETQQVLDDVSFEIKKGEFFGILGRNGSGKSTLLKLISDIYIPTTGEVQISGKLTPFIELGVGFNPELTGRENVFLNGSLLGFNRVEMAAMYKEIVEFAELERFMDQKLKNYSSGMQVRLAFSIAIRANSDILVLDEVLAVGDTAFQRKCYDYFLNLKQGGRTVVFVSHDMGAVQEFCDKALLIDEGHIVSIGAPGEIAKQYSELNASMHKEEEKKYEPDITKKASITSVTSNSGRKTTADFAPGDSITVSMDVVFSEVVKEPIFGITLKDLSDRQIFVTNTKVEKVTTGTYNKGQSVQIEFTFPNIFNTGTYAVSPAVADTQALEFYDWKEGAIQISSNGWENIAGLVHPEHTISINQFKEK